MIERERKSESRFVEKRKKVCERKINRNRERMCVVVCMRDERWRERMCEKDRGMKRECV